MQCDIISRTKSPHNPKVVGSNPSPATKLTAINIAFMAVFFACWSKYRQLYVLYLPLLGKSM